VPLKCLSVRVATFGIGEGSQARPELHLGVDAETGQIVASALTSKEVDDGAQVDSLLDQITGSLSSFAADGAYDQDGVYAAVAVHHPEAAVIVPPRSTAVLSDMAAAAPTQRDRSPPVHRREQPHGLAEGLWLQQAR
jgi:hypothetical protein